MKSTRSGLAVFLIILSSTERIILMSKAKWLLVPSVLTTRFLWLKSVILSQAVMIKVVLSRMLPTKPGTLDKRLWLRAHGSALLGIKTGIKICGNSWAPPFVWGTVNYCSSNSPASNIIMEHKSNSCQACMLPSLCCMFCRGETLAMPGNGTSI